MEYPETSLSLMSALEAIPVVSFWWSVLTLNCIVEIALTTPNAVTEEVCASTGEKFNVSLGSHLSIYILCSPLGVTLTFQSTVAFFKDLKCLI